MLRVDGDFLAWVISGEGPQHVHYMTRYYKDPQVWDTSSEHTLCNSFQEAR